MSDEWGPWIKHDGMGCPCRGMWVESVERSGLVEQHIAEGLYLDSLASAWVWAECTDYTYQIIRYRIRKPRALTLLQEIARDVDAPAPREKEPA